MATSKYPNPYESSWDEESQKWINANLIGLPYDKMVQNGTQIPPPTKRRWKLTLGDKQAKETATPVSRNTTA